MAHEVTIDRSGRLVIPKEVRRAHRLEAGTRFALIEEDERLVLVPRQTEPKLAEQDGLLVVSGVESLDVPDHRSLRDERLDRFAGAK